MMSSAMAPASDLIEGVEDAYACDVAGCAMTTWLCRTHEQWCAKAQGCWTKGGQGSLRVWCRKCCAEHNYLKPSIQALRQNVGCRHAPPPAHQCPAHQALAPPPPPQPAPYAAPATTPAAHAPTPTPAMRLSAVEQRVVEMGGVHQTLCTMISDLESRMIIRSFELESKLRQAEERNLQNHKSFQELAAISNESKLAISNLEWKIREAEEGKSDMSNELSKFMSFMGKKVRELDDAISDVRRAAIPDPSASRSSGSGTSWVAAEGSDAIDAPTTNEPGASSLQSV